MITIQRTHSFKSAIHQFMIKGSSIIALILSMWIVNQSQYDTHVDRGVLLVEFATSHLGKPYGANKGGFDCSGFVQHCYKDIHIDIPRSSIKQGNYGKAVSSNQCKAGDIIVFTGSNKNRRVAGHTGIVSHSSQDTVYFIHSSTSRGIRMDHHKGTYYKDRLLGFRRILK